MRRYEKCVCKRVGLGHCGSARIGGRRTALDLAKESNGLRLEPAIEPYFNSRSFGVRLFLHVGVVSFGSALLWRMPVATIRFGWLALVSHVVEATGVKSGLRPA
jgi:hypothetical protein